MGSKILVASGSGEFFYINVDDLYKQENEILLNYVEDNISFYEAGYNGDRNFGIKDIPKAIFDQLKSNSGAIVLPNQITEEVIEKAEKLSKDTK